MIRLEETWKNIFILKKYWGYPSEKDGECHSFDLCEPCYDKMTAAFVLKPEIKRRDRAAVEKKEETKEKETEERVRKKRMLDVCLLGCGGMMPLPRRWLTALMLRYNGSSILIDCGEGTQIAIKEKGGVLNQSM